LPHALPRRRWLRRLPTQLSRWRRRMRKAAIDPHIRFAPGCPRDQALLHADRVRQLRRRLPCESHAKSETCEHSEGFERGHQSGIVSHFLAPGKPASQRVRKQVKEVFLIRVYLCLSVVPFFPGRR
jgi:hypothetical protein